MAGVDWSSNLPVSSTKVNLVHDKAHPLLMATVNCFILWLPTRVINGQARLKRIGTVGAPEEQRNELDSQGVWHVT